MDDFPLYKKGDDGIHAHTGIPHHLPWAGRQPGLRAERLLWVQSGARAHEGPRVQGTGTGRLCEAWPAAGHWGRTSLWKRRNMFWLTVVHDSGRGGTAASGGRCAEGLAGPVPAGRWCGLLGGAAELRGTGPFGAAGFVGFLVTLRADGVFYLFVSFFNSLSWREHRSNWSLTGSHVHTQTCSPLFFPLPWGMGRARPGLASPLLPWRNQAVPALVGAFLRRVVGRTGPRRLRCPAWLSRCRQRRAGEPGLAGGVCRVDWGP